MMMSYLNVFHEKMAYYLVEVASNEAANFDPFLADFGLALLVLSGIVPRLLLTIVGDTAHEHMAKIKC